MSDFDYVDIVCDYGFEERDVIQLVSPADRSTKPNALIGLHDERWNGELWIEGEYRDVEIRVFVYLDADTKEVFVEVSVDDVSTESIVYADERRMLNDHDEYSTHLTGEYVLKIRVFAE